MKGPAISLSNLSKVSPNKREPDQSSDSRGEPRAILEKGNPDWPCPAPGCPGHIKQVKKKDGGFFGTCDHRVRGDKTTCQVTTTPRGERRTPEALCLVCQGPVGGTPSLGEPTDERDSRGYTVWNNLHACHRVCTGARSADQSKFKYGTNVVEGQDIVGKSCLMSNASTNGKDITKACTGKIKVGDLVVKAWDDPPLHLYCSKRLWASTVQNILDTKQTHKDPGTTAEQEAAKPSAAVPDAFKDF